MPKLLLHLFASIALLLASASAHPVPDSPQWLTYPGGDGPGKGKHIAHITKAVPAADGLSVMVHLEKFEIGHIYDFDLATMASKDGERLLHTKAYYTVNEVPKN